MTTSSDVQDIVRTKMNFRIFLLITILLLVLSVFGILNLLTQGLISTGMHDLVPMGIWLVFYIFFTGLSAGSFIMSTLAYIFNFEKFKPIGRRAIVLALILLVNAPIFLLFDLGRPERVLNLLLYWNFTSILAWGSRLLILYPIICFLYLWALTFTDLVKLAKESTGWRGTLYRILTLGRTEIDDKTSKNMDRLVIIFGIIGIPTAIATHGYTGLLFSVIGAHRLWNTPMMPILFLSSAIISGAALLAMIVMVTDYLTKSPDTIPIVDWSNLLVTFLFIDGIMLFTEFVTVYLANVEEHLNTWNVLLIGQYWFLFWVIELLIGFWLPMIILLIPQLRKNNAAVFFACFFIVIGVFAKRINLIIGGQLTASLTGEVTTYVPTLTEFLISIGGLSAVVFFFVIAWKILPLTKREKIPDIGLEYLDTSSKKDSKS